MRKILIACFILVFSYANASADMLGLYVGGGTWSHDPSGTFGSTQTGSSTINLKSDLNMGKKSDSYVWLAFEHPVPLVPNIRLEESTLTNTGNTGGTFNFNGQSGVTGNFEATMKSTDAIFYYRVLDNWVNLDLGLDVRKVDGTFTLGSNNTVTVSPTVPMLYAAAEFDLPFTGLSVGADTRVISFRGNSYSDSRVRLAYEFGVVGVEAGYRTTKFKLSDVGGMNSDLTFKGLMVGAFLHF